MASYFRQTEARGWMHDVLFETDRHPYPSQPPYPPYPLTKHPTPLLYQPVR